DADAARGGAGGDQRRHDGVTEMLERRLVAEEEGFVGRHRFDDLDDQRLGGRSLEPRDQAREIEQPGLACNRQQPTFDEIVFLGRQHEAGARFQELAEIVVIGGRHGFAPRKARTTLGPIWSSGSTAEHTPASTAEPGMPQITLVASSCAITLPPPVTMSAAPLVPSEPIPVRMSARFQAPLPS